MGFFLRSVLFQFMILWVTNLLVNPVNLVAQDCLPDGITFSRQSQIDEFAAKYPGCTKILGALTISETPATRINSLLGLEEITEVQGSVNISGNTQLKNLLGLHNLVRVGASMRIAANHSLQNLSVFSEIDSIHGDLSISDNSRLSDLRGWEGLKYVGEHLIINENKSLSNLGGLGNLTYVGRDLLVQQNAFLQSLEGLNQLSVIDAHVVVDANPALASLKGFENLRHVQGNFQIVNNDRLGTMTALQNLRYVGGLLQIYNNPALQSLSGLDSIDGETFEDMAILFSGMLSTCNVKSICDYLKDPQNQASVHHNSLGCSSREEILDQCARIPGSTTPRLHGESVFYPNPTNGYLTIRGKILQDATFHITDLVGKQYLKGPIFQNLIDVTQLASGTYVVELTTSEGEELIELVIKM